MTTVEHLVNPSRCAMEQMGKCLRAVIDDKDDLYVWRDVDADHFGFAQHMNLTGKTWLYIQPQEAIISVSSYSHCREKDLTELRKQVQALPRFKFFTVDGLDEEEGENHPTYPEGS